MEWALAFNRLQFPRSDNLSGKYNGVGTWVPQGRCHGFNVGEGKDRLYRFMRNFENVPFLGKDIQLERSTGASLGGALAIRAFSVCPVCSLLGQ